MNGPALASLDYDLLFAKIAEAVRTHATGVSRAVLFGSLARREADTSSDVDLLLVWPSDVDEDVRWDVAIETAHHVDKVAERVCLPFIYAEDEFGQLSRRNPQFAESISRDGIDLLHC